MAYDGTLKFDTSLDPSGLQKGAGSLSSIVKGLGVFELLKKGLNMIINSVDQAMSRIDTLAQFERVMNTMTGSTKQTNAALKATTSIVRDTAFGLDIAAAGVQGFVASGMKVQDATNTMSAWADATSFYTKGTNAELGSVSDALQKMQTKGSVTMQHMQILLQNGIPAIQIYASAVGKSTDEVTQQMSRGELSSAEFIAAMNDAFTTGTDKFPAVAGAAKEAGASWAGSIDNMKAAVARGMANILTSFDGLFNVKGGMVSFGRGIEKVMNGIADNMTAVVPIALTLGAAFVALKSKAAIAGVFSTLSSAMKGAKAVSLGLASAEKLTTAATMQQIVAQKAATVAIAAGNAIKAAASVVMSLFTGGTIAAGVATMGLSVAMKTLGAAIYAALGPFGLILIAITAVVAAVALIVNAFKKSNKAFYDEKDAIKEAKEAHEDYADQLKESAQAAADEQAEKMAQIATNRATIASLQELVAANNAAGDSNHAIAAHVNELNSEMEGLGLAYDSTTGKLNMTDKQLQQYLDDLESVTEYQGAQDEYNRLLGEENSLRQKIIRQEQKEIAYKQMLEDGIIDQSQYNKLIKKSSELIEDYGDSLDGLTIEVEAAKRASQDAYNAEAEASVKAQQIRNTEMDSVKKYATTYGISADQIIDEASRMAGGLEEWSAGNAKLYTEEGTHIQDLAVRWGTTVSAIEAELDRSGIDLTEWEANQIKLYEEWAAAAGKGMDAVVNGFKEIAPNAELSLDELNAILETNNERYLAWKNNLATAAQSLGPEMMSQIESWGPGYNSLLEEYLADPNGEKGQMFYNQLQQAMETGAMGVESVEPKYNEAGVGASEAIGEGLESSDSPERAAESVVADVTAALEGADYSGITSGITNAVNKGLPAVANSIKSMVSAIEKQITSMANKSKTTVSTMMTSLSTAITSKASSVKTAIKSICDDGVKQFDSMKSGATAVGGDMLQGMINGMNNKAGALNDTAYRIVNKAILEMKRAADSNSPSRRTISLFEDIIIGGVIGMRNEEDALYGTAGGIVDKLLDIFDIEPNMTLGMSSLNPLAHGGMVAATAGSGTVNYINMEQTVNTAKALSPYEITRENQDFMRRMQWQL